MRGPRPAVAAAELRGVAWDVQEASALLPNPSYQGLGHGAGRLPAPWPASGDCAPVEPTPADAVGAAALANPAETVREVGIDALRGLAVFVMVGANMVRYVLDEPYPFWLRLYSSLAGPAFILLVGFLVGREHVRRPAPLRRYLKRTAALLLVAALVDLLIWGEQPFASFDVLYVIALIPPAAQLLLRRFGSATVLVTLAALGVTPLLQAVLGYETATMDPGWTRLRAFLVDGWFPVFPWLGVGLLGAVLGAFRQRAGVERFARGTARLGAWVLAVGVAVWWLTGVGERAPGGFAELFYPPTLAVLFAILGPELWLLAHLARPSRGWLWRTFAVYGRTALALYLAHLVIIRLCLGPWLDHRGMATFLALYLAHVIVLWWLAWTLRRFCPAPRSFWGRLLLGS